MGKVWRCDLPVTMEMLDSDSCNQVANSRLEGYPDRAQDMDMQVRSCRTVRHNTRLRGLPSFTR